MPQRARRPRYENSSSLYFAILSRPSTSSEEPTVTSALTMATRSGNTVLTALGFPFPRGSFIRRLILMQRILM